MRKGYWRPPAQEDETRREAAAVSLQIAPDAGGDVSRVGDGAGQVSRQSYQMPAEPAGEPMPGGA